MLVLLYVYVLLRKNYTPINQYKNSSKFLLTQLYKFMLGNFPPTNPVRLGAHYSLDGQISYAFKLFVGTVFFDIFYQTEKK